MGAAFEWATQIVHSLFISRRVKYTWKQNKYNNRSTQHAIAFQTGNVWFYNNMYS